MHLFGRSVVMGLGLALGAAVIWALFATAITVVDEGTRRATATTFSIIREQQARPTQTAEAARADATIQAWDTLRAKVGTRTP
jgi:hypothetical protein